MHYRAYMHYDCGCMPCVDRCLGHNNGPDEWSTLIMTLLLIVTEVLTSEHSIIFK